MGSMKCCIFRSLRRQTPTWKLFPLFSRHKGKLLKMPSNCHSRSVSRLEKPKGERCYGHVQPEAQSHTSVELERPIRKRGRVPVPGLINSHDFHERRFSDIDGVRKIGPTNLIMQSPFRHLFIKVRNEWLGTKLHPLKPFVRSWSSNWSHNSVKCENRLRYVSKTHSEKFPCARENIITKSYRHHFMNSSQLLILWLDGLLVILLIRELNKKLQANFTALRKRPRKLTNRRHSGRLLSFLLNDIFDLQRSK